MKKTLRSFIGVLITLLFCGITFAQEPVVNVDKNVHPNLAQAQQLISQANQYIVAAQKDNRWDMKDHAAKARQLLYQASVELKTAAEVANAAAAKKPK